MWVLLVRWTRVIIALLIYHRFIDVCQRTIFQLLEEGYNMNNFSFVFRIKDQQQRQMQFVSLCIVLFR